MCGFAGFFNTNLFSASVSSKYDIDKMMDLIKHRGPDECRIESYRENFEIEVGFARLAIIDIRDGSQPMTSSDGSITIVCNGEIYNYIELRNELKSQNVQLTTKSDTEVFLKSYEKYGIECLNRIQGMFGAVIIDRRKSEIFLVRDRIGIKPLYYSRVEDGTVIFGSEVKPILFCIGKEASIDRESVAEYLQYRYVHAPRTIYHGINKVLPGHYIEIKGSSFREIKYWDCNSINEMDDLTVEKCKEEVVSNLEDAVRLHLRSDVKIGFFLSGGIDSGLLVALASKFNSDINTYTIRFDNGEYDESDLAEAVAKRYSTNHHCYTVNSYDFEKLLPKMLWYFDEPLADPGILPNFIINDCAHRDGIKVVISGAGGDELFGGYGNYFLNKRERYINSVPLVSRLIADSVRKKSPDFSSKIYRSLQYRESRGKHMIASQQVFRDDEILALTGSKVNVDKKTGYLRSMGKERFNSMLYTDIKTYLTDDLMLLADRSTMAFSMEGRVPFLHHPMVEYSFTIPENIKILGNERKGLLKEIAKEYLPEQLLTAPKMGFTSPVKTWGQGSFGKFAYNILNQERSVVRELWNRDEYKGFVSNMKNYENNFHKIYIMLVLEIFFRVHVDNFFVSADCISEKIYGG